MVSGGRNVNPGGPAVRLIYRKVAAYEDEAFYRFVVGPGSRVGISEAARSVRAFAYTDVS
jgi:hypothetical protein